MNPHWELSLRTNAPSGHSETFDPFYILKGQVLLNREAPGETGGIARYQHLGDFAVRPCLDQ